MITYDVIVHLQVIYSALQRIIYTVVVTATSFQPIMLLEKVGSQFNWNDYLDFERQRPVTALNL